MSGLGSTFDFSALNDLAWKSNAQAVAQDPPQVSQEAPRLTGNVHYFGEQLRFSEAASDEPFWSAAYRKMFPNFAAFMPNANDNDAQRQGIDRVVLLNNGQILKVDEKKRKQDRGDFLLEYLSNDRSRAPGWIEKDLPIDFMAYAFMPSRKVYFFPWHSLRLAWQEHGAEWKQLAGANRNGFRIVDARNPNYSTFSVAVPRAVLFNAITRACLITVEDESTAAL